MPSCLLHPYARSKWPGHCPVMMCYDLFNFLSNRHCSVTPFATSRCVNMMAVTVFAISIPAPPTFEETAFAMSDAQVLVASTTLEIVAMQVCARLPCETILNAIVFATPRHAVTMVENARFRVLPQVHQFFKFLPHMSRKGSLFQKNQTFPSSEQRNLPF